MSNDEETLGKSADSRKRQKQDADTDSPKRKKRKLDKDKSRHKSELPSIKRTPVPLPTSTSLVPLTPEEKIKSEDRRSVKKTSKVQGAGDGQATPKASSSSRLENAKSAKKTPVPLPSMGGAESTKNREAEKSISVQKTPIPLPSVAAIIETKSPKKKRLEESSQEKRHNKKERKVERKLKSEPIDQISQNIVITEVPDSSPGKRREKGKSKKDKSKGIEVEKTDSTVSKEPKPLINGHIDTSKRTEAAPGKIDDQESEILGLSLVNQTSPRLSQKSTPRKSKKKKIPGLTLIDQEKKQGPLCLKLPEGAANSGLHLITANMYLPVQPIAIKYSLDGAIADSLSPLLLSYHPPFKGIVMTHQNARLTEGDGAAAKCVDQYGTSFLWVTVDVLVFRPVKGTLLKGMVIVSTETHMIVHVWNYFSVTVQRKHMPKEWKFIEDEYEEALDKTESEFEARATTEVRYRRTTGNYYDEDGTKVQGEIVIRALDFEVSGVGTADKSLLTIEGSLVSEETEKESQADSAAS
jgi:DNA-directed RNA polymerase I subunit RPA43